MNLKRISCLSLTSTMLLLPAWLSPHGGQYRGPRDLVPPNPGGGRTGGGGQGGPTTPTPGGPTTPTPGGPNRPTPTGSPFPTPNGSGGQGGSRRGPASGGVSLAGDLSLWTYWWEFNKAQFLELKKAIHQERPVTGSPDFIIGRGIKEHTGSTLAPGRSDRRKIVAALQRALEETTNRDIISSALVGLAKVAEDRSILAVSRRFLKEQDQEKRETATLAMGIAAIEEAIPDLIALALDEARGRKLVERREVDFRTRSFACYGLGLIAHRSKNAELQQRVFEAMKQMIERGYKERVHRDLIVSPLQAIRLLRPDSETPAGRSLRDDAVEFLSSVMALSDRQVYAHVRSHAYVAVAELLGRGRDASGLITRRMLEDVKNRRQKSWIHQSAILALGQIALPEDLEVSKAIREYMHRGKDLQARRFCAITLGQIGGDANRSFLCGSLRRARTQHKPWIALGLAVRDHEERRSNPDLVDRTACDAIRGAFEQTRNPLSAAGLAIALGIMKDRASGDLVLERLLKIKQDPEPAGLLAVALGLMGHYDAKDTLQSLLEDSKRRPTLLSRCAIALGLLGDKEVSMGLTRHIEDTQVVAVYSAIAQALGLIGDRRSIVPLIRLLENESVKPLPRAFAAVALGLVGDKEEFPWNSKIAEDNNYRASVETLTGSGNGILDIL